MNVKSLNKIALIWLFVILPLTGAILFRKSFDLGLYGDDWQHLYNLWRDFFVYHTKSFFDIRSYLNPYFPESLYLGIISHFWGYYPPAYFISSFLCRVFANIALYFFSYELTKSKLAAFLTSLLFLVSAAGLQTTDWVFNMNTYIGLGLLAIASTIYLKIRNLKTFKSWLYPFFIVTFTIALAVVPTRMHGAAPFIILTDLFLTYVIERQRIKFDKHIIIRIFLAGGIFAMLIHFKSFGETSYTNGRFSDSYKLTQSLMQNGFYSWWLYFLAIIGHLIIPDNISLTVGNTLKKVLVSEAFISLLFMCISSYSILKSKKIFPYLIVLIFNLLWTVFLLVMSKIDTHTSFDIFFNISLGGQFLFSFIWFYLIGKNRYPEISKALIIAVIWVISLTIIHWLFTPYFVIETTGRYMTMAAAGMAIYLGTLITLLLKSAFAQTSTEAGTNLPVALFLLIPSFILFILLTTNIQTSQAYFDILQQTRNKELTQKTWNNLMMEVPKLDPNGPSVFYFTTDNPQSLEGVLVFGFFMRAGMTYRIPNQDLTPLPVTDYQQLLDMVKTGEPLQKVHGRKAVPVPLSRVFAFDFRNGELINITDQVRKEITKDLNLIETTK